MKSRVWALVCALGSLGSMGCVATAQPQSTLTVALIDGSCSRVNLGAYRTGWAAVEKSVQPGDRIVLGRIGADVREFHPELDVVRPQVAALLDNDLVRQERDDAFNEKLADAFSSTLAVPCSNLTAILDTLDVAAQYFSTDARARHRLVLLTDALEDSQEAKFERGLSGSAASRLLSSRRRAHGLPHLAGVEVFVGGASAPTGEIARAVRQFWLAYFAATGARLSAEHYGPVLLGLEP